MKYSVNEQQYKEWLKTPYKSFNELMQQEKFNAEDIGVLYLHNIATSLSEFLNNEHDDCVITVDTFRKFFNTQSDDEKQKSYLYQLIGKLIFAKTDQSINCYTNIDDSLTFLNLISNQKIDFSDDDLSQDIQNPYSKKSMNDEEMMHYHVQRLHMIENIYHNNAFLSALFYAFKFDFLNTCLVDTKKLDDGIDTLMKNLKVSDKWLQLRKNQKSIYKDTFKIYKTSFCKLARCNIGDMASKLQEYTDNTYSFFEKMVLYNVTFKDIDDIFNE